MSGYSGIYAKKTTQQKKIRTWNWMGCTNSQGINSQAKAGISGEIPTAAWVFRTKFHGPPGFPIFPAPSCS